jgi:shikimate kinase
MSEREGSQREQRATRTDRPALAPGGLSEERAQHARVVLVGPPAAGKTTVGRLLADRLSVPFVDTDDLVVERAGKPVSDIFVDDGEEEFRRLETEALAEALTRDAVVALGGGAVLADQNRERLAGHPVVLLAAGVPTSAARVGLNRDRPLLLGNPRQRLRELLAERLPLYREVAVAEVDTDERTPAEVADAVLAAVSAPDRT